MGNNKNSARRNGEHLSVLGGENHYSNNGLLEQYLAMTQERRNQKFPTTARAAAMVGMSQRTIQFWIHIGKFEAVFIGGKWRVNIDSLIEFLERRAEARML